MTGTDWLQAHGLPLSLSYQHRVAPWLLSPPVQNISAHLFTIIYKSHNVVQSCPSVSGFIGQCASLAVALTELKEVRVSLCGPFHTRTHCVLQNCLLAPRLPSMGTVAVHFDLQNAAGAGGRCIRTDFSNPLNDAASMSFKAQITVTSYKKPSWIPQPE